MLCLKKRRTYSFTQGVCADLPRRTKKDNNHRYEGSLNMAITTLPRKNRSREERPSRMVLTVTEDTPADMLAGSMELLVQLPHDHHLQSQRVTVQRSTPMMDLLVQIATAHKLAASSYTLQAIGERGMVLPHQPNTPIGALDALQVKLLPKQGTFLPRKAKQANQPFETTFRLQVHLPRNQLYVSRVSPKMNLGEILDEVCREKNLDKNKYELRHPANLEETLDLSLSLQDYHLQEVTLYARQARNVGSALSTQDILALQRQEERRRQQARQGVFGFVFKKSKEGSLSTDSLGGRSASPGSDETGRSSPLQPPARPIRKRRPAPKPPQRVDEGADDGGKDKVVISHSRNSSDSSGYHEASVLSDNPDSRFPETLPRRRAETPRKLAQTAQSSKSLGNLAAVSGTLTRGASSTSLSSAGLKKKRAAPPPPVSRPLSSAISTQALERIVDSEESLTSDMDPSKPPSDIGVPSKANSDIEDRPKANSDIGVTTSSIEFKSTTPDILTVEALQTPTRADVATLRTAPSSRKMDPENPAPVDEAPVLEARVTRKRVGEPVPLPKPRTAGTRSSLVPPQAPKRRLAPVSPMRRTADVDLDTVDSLHQVVDATPDVATPSNGEKETPKNSMADEVDVDECPAPGDDTPLVPSGQRTPDTINLNSTEKSIEPNPTPEKNETRVKGEPEHQEAKKTDIILEPEKNVTQRVNTGSKNSCAVISTVPKCEHLDIFHEKDNSMKQEKMERKKWEDGVATLGKDEMAAKERKRAKTILRSMSKSNDFEVNSLERQKRHLTSHAEDITFALNLNLSSNVLATERSKEDGEDGVDLEGGGVDENSLRGLGTSDAELSETDILLQKVSDTLTNSLPVSTDITTGSQGEATIKDTSSRKQVKQVESKQTGNDLTDASIVNSSTPNLTLSSQQDTSDYVSAVDDDLSIAEWEYQLPAPPTAFRDTASPVFDEKPTITTFKHPDPPRVSDTLEDTPKIPSNPEETKTNPSIDGETIRKNHPKQTKPEASLKKEVIHELENKIGSLPLKDLDHKKIQDTVSTPKIAPVDNTLSNFTITTYSRQKSPNIFEEPSPKSPDERFVRSFATLSRSKVGQDDVEERNVKRKPMIEEKRKQEPKMEGESLQRWRPETEQKINIQRSKSYLSVCDGVKHENTREDDVTEVEESAEGVMKKSTSITNLNGNAQRSNEKFSQWRENILKRQEEPTKEKQLQSLQVLKSILPQLKSAQQAEENVSKESNGAVLTETSRSEAASDGHSTESNVVSGRETQTTTSSRKPDSEPKKPTPEVSGKRYTYSGPPAISLGSWSERPSANVQIKMDTDYKLGLKKVGRTIVSINGAKDEGNHVNGTENTGKPPLKSKFEMKSENCDKREPDELTRKLITHTTASGFRKPVLNKVNIESKANNDKPIVTAVELKRTFVERNDGKNGNDVIDTTPVNFKELTKAFGQDVCLRAKPHRSNSNRCSLQIESTQSSETGKQNGHANFERQEMVNNHVLKNGDQGNHRPKRFTSIVGINPQSQMQNGSFRNGISVKTSQPMPVVKGFKIQNSQVDTKEIKEFPRDACNGPQPPRPPTMPVITGVTLKNANVRPKSMPVQVDPRDTLLESIRNFGGHRNLKNAAERC